MTISPAEHFLNWQQDPFGNYLARVVFPDKAAELDITVGLVADMEVINPFDFFVEDYAERYPFRYPAGLADDLKPYLEPAAGTVGPVIEQWLARQPVTEGGQPVVTFLADLNAAVYGDVAYSTRMEEGVQTPDQTLSRKIGSCRDSAWLLVTALRHCGLAARFVSGYLVQLAPDQQPHRRVRAEPVRTSPTCTPGPRSTFPAPAGSVSTRPRRCSPARAISRSPPLPTRRRRPRSPAPPSPVR